MDLGRPIARHTARRPQESGDDRLLRGSTSPAGDHVKTPATSELAQPPSPDHAPVDLPTR